MKSDPDQRIAETLIEPEAHGLRLDFYLQRRFSYRSRTEWQKSIEDGEILLNGRRTKSSRKLQTGEKIAFIPKPYEEPAVDRSFVLLEENEKYLIVSKPGNLPCHPAGVFFRNTLWHLLRERYGETVSYCNPPRPRNLRRCTCRPDSGNRSGIHPRIDGNQRPQTVHRDRSRQLSHGTDGKRLAFPGSIDCNPQKTPFHL